MPRNAAAHPFAETIRRFETASGDGGRLFSLPALAERFPGVARLPVSLRIVLESVLRHCDGRKVTAEHVAQLAGWAPKAPRSEEIPFVVARVVLQDFTGVPLLADLAAMRNVAERLGRDPKTIEPLVPVDLVVDHSVMVDHYGSPQALDLNMQLEFRRNRERYQFMKWGMGAFSTFGVVPPGFGIVHQVNLEYLARGVHRGADGVVYPDTLVGTDSHTTMINGVGVVGWGVGGIEAEAAMLDQPVYLLTPDVVGFELSGRLREGVTATDLVLTITEILRREKVVGKFVEFCGEGTRSLSVPDRATIANMAPEYGATMGFFPVDEKTVEYFAGTGRTAAEIEAFEAYFRAQGLFGVPAAGAIEYSSLIRLDLATVAPSLAGPKRPQDRIEIGDVKRRFAELFSAPVAANGFGQPASRLGRPVKAGDGPELRNGDVLIAAITSCTNTSNPGVMLAAGLLAKKAVEAGLTVKPHVKTSLAPGSRIVTEYLTKTGLLPYLERLGFAVAAYGCTTCIGNAGDLAPELNEAITANDLVCAAVLSGNRNFEARIHPNLKANFLASPPLVVAYAIAGTVQRDLMTEPVGTGHDGREIWLGDIWPTSDEVAALMRSAMDGAAYRRNYARVQAEPGALWQQIAGAGGEVYSWPKSTYIAEPPFFRDFQLAPPPVQPGVRGARIIGLFGDSITTDHISPAGSFRETTPAGRYLLEQGVLPADFNSYGARRGHHRHLRQRAHQEPDDPAARGRLTRRRRLHAVPRRHRHAGAAADLRRRDALRRHQRADRRVRRRGVRHRLQPRLGGQGHDAAGHPGRRRAQLRAHPPQQPDRHGRAAAAVQARRVLAEPGTRRRRDRRRAAGPAGAAAVRRDAGPHRRRRHAARGGGDAAHRHPDRGRVLAPRRHPAVRAAPVARRLKPAQPAPFSMR